MPIYRRYNNMETNPTYSSDGYPLQPYSTIPTYITHPIRSVLYHTSKSLLPVSIFILCSLLLSRYTNTVSISLAMQLFIFVSIIWYFHCVREFRAERYLSYYIVLLNPNLFHKITVKYAAEAIQSRIFNPFRKDYEELEVQNKKL